MIASCNILLLIVLLLLGITLVVQLFYYLYFYLMVWLYRPESNKPSTVPVSVIICARNEEVNLRQFLPYVLEQDYPDYEVIVVNDCSEDESFEVLGDYLDKYHNLKLSFITKDPKFTHNKKFAQFIGIKASKNEILLFTDADCKPESNKWISLMTAGFEEKTDFILGYGGYFREKGLMNKYVRYESMTIAMQYFGMALRGIPYMGVGRNLAYRKSMFFNKKGFGSHNQLISGDDDLFVNANANKYNTRVEFRKDAHTRSVPAKEIKEWIKQKKRHLTTATHYKFKDKLILSVEPATRIIFYLTFFLLLSGLNFLPFLLAAFIIRSGTQAVVFSLAQKKFNEPGILIYALFFDIISPFINSIIYLSNIGSGKTKIIWK